MILSLESVGKSYVSKGGACVRALEGVSLSVRAGEFVSVIGRSGCGKSTLLQVAAGLLPCDSGRTDRVSKIAMVFQSHALLPWRSVESNVAYPLELAGEPRPESRRRAREALSRMGIADLGDRYPRELSGGQAQRAALARAFVVSPELILMDEPFAAVDALTRSTLHEVLRSERERTGAGALLVTHCLEEALLLSDRILVLGGSPGTVTGELPVSSREVTGADRARLLELLALS